MSENLKNFLALANQDDSLLDRLASLREAEQEEALPQIIELAKEKGVTLTESDFDGEQASEGEIDEDALENVSGGVMFFDGWFERLFGGLFSRAGQDEQIQDLNYSPAKHASSPRTLEYRPDRDSGSFRTLEKRYTGKTPPGGGITLL